MTCSTCGADVAPGQQFCGSCGATLAIDDADGAPGDGGRMVIDVGDAERDSPAAREWGPVGSILADSPSGTVVAPPPVGGLHPVGVLPPVDPPPLGPGGAPADFPHGSTVLPPVGPPERHGLSRTAIIALCVGLL